jgi:hypothetical protein
VTTKTKPPTEAGEANMLAAIGVVELNRFVNRRLNVSQQACAIVAALVVAVFVGVPAWIAYSAGPHYALYTNALAADKVGYFFPHDEFYDDGLREAIKFVCDTAPRGTLIAYETPGVTGYYLEQFQRTDLNSDLSAGFRCCKDFRPGLLHCSARSNILRESR